MTVFTVREEPDGLTIHGGHFLRTATTGDLVDRIAKVARGDEESPERKKLQELQVKRDRLHAELAELLAADAKRVEEGRSKKKKK